MRFIHVISNVIYGGGEQVLITLAKERSANNYIYFLRRSRKIPYLDNIDNSSIFKAKDNYISYLDHLKNFIYLFFVIIKIKFNHNGKFAIVFHGFPCQYLIWFSKMINPNIKVYMIYHQIKNNHGGLMFIVRVIENLFIYIFNPIVGAPSKRAVDAIKNYLFSITKKKVLFFEFKNCFSPIIYNSKSEDIYNQFSKQKPFLLTVSRFDNQKGHLRLLRFIKNNSEISERFNFLLAGDGKNLEKCKLYKHIHNLKNVKFLGSLDRSDLFMFYKNSEGIIIPSYKEAYGVSIIEALSFNKVVITFEESLLINKNVKLVDPLSKDFCFLDFKNILCWDNKAKKSFFYTSEDTMNSLKVF